MDTFTTRASSINRALDQIGDKWCLLIIQEAFWGVKSFKDFMTSTGASRGVLSNRLKWLQSVDCLRQHQVAGSKRLEYRLTPKTLDLYHTALMALAFEQGQFREDRQEHITLTHRGCGKVFTPLLHCSACHGEVNVWDVDYRPGPGATRDERDKKVRRRSSIPVAQVPSARAYYRNLINIVGDRPVHELRVAIGKSAQRER